MAEPAKRPPRQIVVSALTPDEIVETVFQPSAVRTAFAISGPAGINICEEWRSGAIARVPIRPTNNLIKHEAVLLPSEPSEFNSPDALLADIARYIRTYVSLSEERTQLCAAYVLLSWVYDAFNELPYLRFRGDYGTGKTRALIVIGSLCYKTFFAGGASTVSPIFHTLDTFRGTLVFDEADFRFSDEKAELVKILNNGNAKGFPVLRTQMTERKEFDPRAFAVFGPKIVGMRRQFEDRALESRFLTIDMEAGQLGEVPINLPDVQKDEALELRNKLLMYRFSKRRAVVLDPALFDPALEPRMNQILLPLLSVVPTTELREVIRRSARSVQADIVSERSISTEGQLLTVLDTLIAEPGVKNVSLTQISTAFAAEFGSDYERPIHNRWIGVVLRRLGVSLYKSNGVVVLVPGQEKRIAALCVRFGIGSASGDAKSI